MRYHKIYHKNYFDRTDGIKSWSNKKLKFGDALACICYAHGIHYDKMRKHFGISYLGKEENTEHTVQEQIDFILKNKKRTPKKILEIGGGRGEVTVFLSKMGYDVVCIEPCPQAPEWFEKTSLQYFGEKLPYKLLVGSVTQFVDDPELDGIDTVLMVESLEHILEKDFNPMYKRINSELSSSGGLFNVTNWIDYHPIPVGYMAPPREHCRLTDDNLYDKFEKDFKYCYLRIGSHLSIGNDKNLFEKISYCS